jgi:hypothetical protein
MAAEGLSQSAVEKAIVATIQTATKDASAVGSFWGTVAVSGKTIAFKVTELATQYHVGTYYVVH